MHWIKEITQLVLSLVQLVAALTLIGLIIEPQLADGMNRLETAQSTGGQSPLRAPSSTGRAILFPM